MNAMKRPSFLQKVKQNFLKLPKKETPKTYSDVLKELAESSSLHGIGKVVSSRQLAVKVLWMLLLVATMSVFGVQLYKLFETFYSNPIQTSVSLSFSPLKFPSITFCNMNAIKRSLLNSSEHIAKVFYEDATSTKRRKKRDIDLETLQKQNEHDFAKAVTVEPLIKPSSGGIDVKSWKEVMEEHEAYMQNVKNIRPSRQRSSESETSDNSLERSADSGKGFEDFGGSGFHGYDEYERDDEVQKRFRRGVSGSGSGDTSSSSGSYPMSSSYYSGDYSGYYDDYYSSGYYSGDYDFGSHLQDQLNSPKDQWEVKIAKFRVEFRNETRERRIELGHKLDDFVYQASFAGSLQNKSSDRFKVFTTTDYGNCYTMESPNYVAWRSGPSNGIKVTLNLEVNEYIKNFASGYGVRLVIHTPGTYPFPADEGLMLSAGTETNVGLRVVRVKRLGSPYGECTSGDDFENKYGYKYSSTACYEFCRTKTVIQSCGCIPPTGPSDKDFNTTEMRICQYGEKQNATDMKCILEVEFRLTNLGCGCISPCSQSVYEKTVSSRIWPKHDYLEQYLLPELCEKNEPSLKTLCDLLNNSNSEYEDITEIEKYRINFLRFVVYFEDLNYENIVEEPLYSSVRFLSDIGGAMGLFMGASVLTYVELLQLLLETFLFCRYKYRTRAQNRVTEMEINGKEKE